MLEHRRLRYFTAVAEELNFSRAADRLHMAQPPLSVAIRNLERELGTELLVRTTRDVRLTEAGATLLAGARRVLAELEQLAEATRRAGAGELGSLRLAFSSITRYETLPMLGRAFRASHPDIELLTEEMWNVKVVSALRAAAVDVALCTCPERSADIACETVRWEHIVALLPDSHPLAERPELALGELAEEVFLLVPREVSPRLHDTLIHACRRAGFEPRLRSGGLQNAWELEVLGQLDLVSLAPRSMFLDLPPGVAALHVRDLDDRIETAIVTRADETSPIVAGLRETARTLFSHETLGLRAV